jgi:hypothetical protein
MMIRRVAEDDRRMSIRPEQFHVARRILDVQIRTDGGFVGEETQVPVWNVVTIEPIDCLLYCDAVKILDEQPVGNDPDSDTFCRESPEHLWRPGDRLENAKEVALGHGKLVQLPVAPRRLWDSPFRQVPRDKRRQRLRVDTEPLGRDRAQTLVKICAGAVKVYAKDEGRIHRQSKSRLKRLLQLSSSMPQSQVFEAVFKLEDLVGASWSHIHAAYEASAQLHASLARAVEGISTPDASIMVAGSLGRFEVTSESDIDWTYLIDGEADLRHQVNVIDANARIEKLVTNKPGREGVFGALVFSHTLLQFIGGQDDTNSNLTPRILMLLESKPVGRQDAYKRVVEVVLERYLTGDHGWTHSRTELGIPRFLYNDIARYWRTVTVDFAYKQWTRDNKGWALRKVKLRLARKLTYAAGMLYCFSLAEGIWPSAKDSEPSRKQKAIDRLWSLTTGTPLDLLAQAFMMSDSLRAPARKAFDAYDQFLGMLNDPRRARSPRELAAGRAR